METYKNMCRACLTTKETFTNFIHQNVSQDLFWFCTSIQVLPDDDLTKALCNVCHQLLTQFSEFKRSCIQSNETLTCINGKLKSDPDESHEFDTCDSELLLHSEVEVKDEYEPSDPSQDDYVATDYNDDPTDKADQPKRCKKKKKIKPRPFRFNCEHCNKKFVDADRYEGHKLMHLGKPVKIQCLPCNKVFHTWYNLTRHKKHVHTTVSLESLRCSLCGKVSKNGQTLQMHRMKHREQLAMMCDVCGRWFKSKSILMTHLRTHEEKRPRSFTCEDCGSKFDSQSSLNNHARKRHHGQPFVCDLCGYPFREKFSLVKHILRHDGKKFYKCDLCAKSFAGRSSLVDHMRIHSGEKPYACPDCDNRFRTRRILVEHRRTHTGEKPYKCSLCTHAFTQRGSLKRHMKVHDKTAPAQPTNALVASVDAYGVTKPGLS